MRVYFEKPRTTVGWKGLINDPHLNDTFDIATGLRIGRRILLEIASMGLPAATELLEPITPQYIADLISLTAIGARTTESPTHRQMASGLSMPVGFKNGTDGSLQVAIDAMLAARSQHSFLGIDNSGQTCIVNTKGNPWGFLILRGGRSEVRTTVPESLGKKAVNRLNGKAKLPPRLMVDCSHANSNKDYRLQHVCWDDCLAQPKAGRLKREHRRPDDRKQSATREPNADEQSEAIAIRRLDHRWLHRLGRNRTVDHVGP